MAVSICRRRGSKTTIGSRRQSRGHARRIRFVF